MRAEFPWIPVYTTLYFYADPYWTLKGLVPSRLIYPSAYYEGLLRDTCRLIIAPPPKHRPLSAEIVGNELSLLHREINTAYVQHPLQANAWDLARDGLLLAEHWSQAPP